jgi:hypothetical protein
MKKVQKAHKNCKNNKEEISKSEICACFYCKKLFKPYEVTKWISEVAGYTATCPHCGIDSVLGSASGYDLTPKFIQQMNEFWFSIPKP